MNNSISSLTGIATPGSSTDNERQRLSPRNNGLSTYFTIPINDDNTDWSFNTWNKRCCLFIGGMSLMVAITVATMIYTQKTGE